MDAQYTTSVIKATTDLFATMMMMELTPGDALSSRSEMEKEVVITGIIGLAGVYKGTISIHFSKAMALKSISAMLGMEFDELTDDTKDAIGEIANIVAGGAKTELSAHGVAFDLSLPTVIAGENYSVFHTDAARKGKGTIVPFSCDGQRMFVEFDLEKSEKA